MTDIEKEEIIDEIAFRLDSIITDKVGKILSEKLEMQIRALVEDKIKEYIHIDGREEILQLIYKNMKLNEKPDEIAQHRNSLEEEKECPAEDGKAVITRLALNLGEIFQDREVESEEMFIKMILEFINSIKSENRAIEKRYKEKEELTHELEETISQKNTEVSELNEKISKLRKQIEEERREAEKDLGIVKGELTKTERELKTAENKLKELNNEKKHLENQITEKTSEYNKLKIKSDEFKENAEKEMNSLTQDINKQKEKIEKNKIEKAKLQDLYNIANLYEKYLGISQTTKDKLTNLVRSENIGNFAVCCYHLDTMDDIWEFVNAEVRSGTLKDTDCKVLAEIFTYFVEQKNKMYKEALYRVAVPEKGEYFDATKHLDADRNGADKIKEVIFPGYGVLEDRKDSAQRDDERKYKRMKKLPIVKTM